MTTRGWIVGASLALAADARVGAADEPALDRVGEANLETTASRKTLMATLAAGGSITFGVGIDDVGGNGGAGSLRLGRVATPRALATLEISGTATLHRPAKDAPLATNNASGVLAGLQYFVGPSLWVRGGVGVGTYRAEQSDLDGTGTVIAHRVAYGAGFLGGAGVELARFRHVSLGLETFVLSLVTRDGDITTGAFLLDVSVY